MLFQDCDGVKYEESTRESVIQGYFGGPPSALLGSLRNHDGNGDGNAKLLLFQNFRFKRFLPFRSNLLPMRDSQVVLFNFTTWKPHFWRSVLQI